MSRVLLFGATGAVGAGCLNALAHWDDVSTVIAGRDEARLREIGSKIRTDIEVTQLDITDAPAVKDAVAQCDLVINCAGPSHLVSAQIASAAIESRVSYVDPGGDQTLLDRLTEAETDVPVVLQTGVQPGLSGLLLCTLALSTREKIDSISAWCGGLQPLTAASVDEYLASLHTPHGHPTAALRDGRIERMRNDEVQPAPAPYFPESVSVHPHLDSETIAVAKHLDIGNVSWFNVLDGSRTKKAMQLLASGDGRQEHGEDLDSVLAAAKLDLFGRDPYFALVACAYNRTHRTTVAFTCADSFQVSGALTAFAARRATSMSAGVHPFWTIDDPWEALAFVSDEVPRAEVSVLEDTAAVFRVSELATIEEGSL